MLRTGAAAHDTTAIPSTTRGSACQRRRPPGVAAGVRGLSANGSDPPFGAHTRASDDGMAGVDRPGLGLPIVKSRVDLHGGTVGATRRRGGGAIVWVEPPTAPGEASAPGTAPTLARRRLA